MEMLIRGHLPDEWPMVRSRAATISAIVMLVQLEDAKHGGTNATQPKAATLIFQLFGHIWDVSKVPAFVKANQEGREVDPDDLPSEEEESQFISDVAIPVMLDAITLARVAGATGISEEIGSFTEFAQDVQAVSIGSIGDGLRTAGARQYIELFDLNARLLELQGLDVFA